MLEMAAGTQNARRPAEAARQAGAAGMRAGPLGPQGSRGTYVARTAAGAILGAGALMLQAQPLGTHRVLSVAPQT